MDVPATAAGKVQDVRVKVGDTVSEGTVVVVVSGDGAGPLTTPPSLVGQQEPEPETTPAAPARARPRRPGALGPAGRPGAGRPAGAIADFTGAHAGPSVRRLARELDLDLNTIKGTGEKGRIVKEDLLAAVRGPAAAPAAAAPAGAPASPRSRPRTSPSSARSRPSPCRGSRSCPARSCTGRG